MQWVSWAVGFPLSREAHWGIGPVSFARMKSQALAVSCLIADPSGRVPALPPGWTATDPVNSISMVLPLSNKPHMAQTKHGVFENKWIEMALIYSDTVLCICSLQFSLPTNTIRESSGSHLVCKRRRESDTLQNREYQCLGLLSNGPLQCPDNAFWASLLTTSTVEPLGKVGECLGVLGKKACVTLTLIIVLMHSDAQYHHMQPGQTTLAKALL